MVSDKRITVIARFTSFTGKCKESASLLSGIQAFPKQENTFSNRQVTGHKAVFFMQSYSYRQKYLPCRLYPDIKTIVILR